MKYDFGGWATRNDLLCSDGRTIRKNAFKNQNGGKVPLVWNHNHSDPNNVLGHAHLENRDEGVYAYCIFNDSESGKTAKELVKHGDVRSLSIFANNLKQSGGDVLHGVIREVSLVLAGANPGAFIDNVMAHGEEGEGVILGYDENITLYHSENKSETEGEKKMPEANKEKTVKDVFDEMTEEQQTVVYALIGQALESANENDDEDDDEGEQKMKHNLFDTQSMGYLEEPTLSHADQSQILSIAKSNSVGSLRTAMEIFSEQNEGVLAHGFDNIDYLFPDFKDIKPGAPDLLSRDHSWVSQVMNGVHKSPFSRIRTRKADIRGKDMEAYGYKTKGSKKKEAGNIKLLKRTTDPQTVYRKDSLNRDDIIDITDFDVVVYQYAIMRRLLEEEVALAIMIGDGRDEGDEQKIEPTHIRPIWTDDELYTIKAEVNLAKAQAELQGSNTGANFGKNYIFAEAIISASLYSREMYKGTGTPDFYCTPHLLNVMLLARDLNGRRIYDSKEDLARALNVNKIHTVEQFEGQVRTTSESKKKKLLGLFVNLTDYQIGATKGGEITKFNQFDIDFNQEKYLIETRLSGALVEAYSAIALEIDVTDGDTTESVG